jgi:hypothetical protein
MRFRLKARRIPCSSLVSGKLWPLVVWSQSTYLKKKTRSRAPRGGERPAEAHSYTSLEKAHERFGAKRLEILTRYWAVRPTRAPNRLM